MSVNYNINSILKQSCILAVTASLLLALIFFVAGYSGFSLSLLVNIPIGIVALIFLVKDVQNAFQMQTLKIIQLKFIFRLACFAILLYLILVRLKLNPFGAALGFTLPIFSAMAVFFRIAKNETKDT